MKTDKVTRITNLFNRKEKAQQIVDYFEREEIKTVFDEAEAEVVKAIKALAFNDYEGQKALFHELRCLELVRRKINKNIAELQTINHNMEVANGRGN